MSPTAIALLAPGGAIHVTVGSATRVGPWSLVAGLPHPDGISPGPPPSYLALAAWAA